MNHRGRSYLIAVVTFLVVQLAVTYSSGTDSGEAGQQTIEGLVRDISCPLQNKAATATKFNLQYARQCVSRVRQSSSFPRTMISISLSQTRCRTKANENGYCRLLASM